MSASTWSAAVATQGNYLDLDRTCGVPVKIGSQGVYEVADFAERVATVSEVLRPFQAVAAAVSRARLLDVFTYLYLILSVVSGLSLIYFLASSVSGILWSALSLISTMVFGCMFIMVFKIRRTLSKK